MKHTDFAIFFVLKKKSNDWKRLRSEFNLVNVDGLEYYWRFLQADYIFCSHGLILPRGARRFDRKDYKLIWLQHGIIHENLSQMYNAQCRHDLVTVATRDEYTDRLSPKYGYSTDQVVLTGLARFDYLQNRPRKVITIALTWRKYLLQSSEKEFTDSNYFHIWEKMIIHPELADLAQKYGYQIQVVFHHMLNSDIKRYLKRKCDSRISILENAHYMDIIGDSSLLITDYSSVAFDMAYLKKPIVYYQEDYHEFFSGKHTYTAGYYNYGRDGFGEVANSKKSLLESVEECLLNQCEMTEKYIHRVEETFEYFDHNNCERIWSEVEKRFLKNPGN